MKKLSFLPVIALVLGIAGAAFSMEGKQESTETRYHYKLTTQEGIFDASNWEPADASYPGCNGQGLPCVIAITGDLQDFLDNAEVNGGVSAINLEAESQQP